MKLHLSILFFIVIYLFSLNPEKELYYWEGKIKHSFVIDTSLSLVEVKQTASEIELLQTSFSDIESIRIKDDSTVQYITKNKASLLSKLDTKSVIYEYPSILLDGGAISFITDEISIRFAEEPSKEELEKFEREYDIKLLFQTSYGAHIFASLNPNRTLEIANSIQESGKVIWGSPNFVHLISLHNDPLYPDQFYLNNTGQGGGTANIDINAPEAWGITLGCDNIRIAIIDDGVDNHEDFDGRVLPGFTAGINDTGGIPANHCSKGHGVACAGIIAASHNSIGIKGIAPNSQIIPINIFPLLPVTGNPAGAATSADIAEAINWAWEPLLGNADILSNSWGGGVPDINITAEILAARTQGRGGRGAIVIFSSGNSHEDFSGVVYPASLNGVITVGAIKNNGSIWEYSSRGPEMDLVAPSGNLGSRNSQFCITPGGNVRTTDRMGANGYETGNYSNGFGGTSAAAPQVSGAAALMLSVNPNLTETQVRTFLQQSAWDMGAAGFDNTFGHGRLNAYAAVRAALPPISGPEFLCSSNSYSITNLPVGTVASWSVSPSSLFAGSTSGSGTSANLSPSSSLSSGQATLTFNLSYGCGSFQVQRTIWVGKGTIGIYGADEMPFNTVEYYYATTDGSVTAYDWSVYPSGYEWIGNQGTSGITLSISSPGFYSLTLDVTNPCGVRGGEVPIYVYDPFSMFTIYPNPASDIMTISKKSTLSSKQTDTTPFEISLYDSRGQQLLGPVSGSEEVGLDVSHLKNGFYFVHILYKGELIKNQIRVER